MPATITFKVESINDAGSQVTVTFLISAAVGTQGGPSTSMNLSFPAAEGKEFEVDDTYALEIAPKPEAQH